jgi:methylated-DNA-protein-cysteine methyltransferase-like protein
MLRPPVRTAAVAREQTSERYRRIYAVVKKIPRGKIATYGQVAALAGIARGSRQVGTALRNAPDGLKLPWQRVINAQGRISLRLREWQSGSDDLQRVLLEAEGIVFSAEGSIDLQQYRWRPKIAGQQDGDGHGELPGAARR